MKHLSLRPLRSTTRRLLAGGRHGLTAYALFGSSALALLVAGCGEAAESPATPSTTDRAATAAERDATPIDRPPVSNTASSSAASASLDLDIIVPPGAGGELPADLWVSCENGYPSFQISDLDGIVPVDAADPGGLAEALDSMLASDEGVFWPQEDWKILRQTESAKMLVHKDADSVSFIVVQLVDGIWKWTGGQRGGPCPLSYIVPEGLNAVNWRLDPEASPEPGSTSLAVLVTERECVSGQDIGDRLRGPQVVMTASDVRIAFAAEPPSGNAFRCPSNPETRTTVELPAPLGDREVIEGLSIGLDLEDYLD